jgi:hypothetical protein
MGMASSLHAASTEMLMRKPSDQIKGADAGWLKAKHHLAIPSFS